MEQNHRLRVMHVHDFYPAYVKDFYSRNPDQMTRDSKSQREVLVKDGFSAIHIFTLYLPQERFETELVVPEAAPAHLAWCWENGLPWEPDLGSMEIVRQRIEHSKPDILYFADPVKYNGKFLKTLAHKPKMVIGWKAADVPWNWDLLGYDMLLSGLPKMLSFAARQGAKRVKLFKPGMPQWLADAVTNTPKTVDVCFAGSISPSQHCGRIAMLNAVCHTAATNGFSVALHLNCASSLITPAMRPYVKAPVFGLTMQKELARAKIVIDDRANHGVVMPNGDKKIDLGGDDTINMRLFEATGSGSFLLTQKLAGVDKYFTPGKELDTWEDIHDLTKKILYWLDNPEKREKIAQAGHSRCLTEHNMEKSANRFAEIILSYVNSRHQD